MSAILLILLALGPLVVSCEDHTPPTCEVVKRGSCPTSTTEYGCRDDQTWTATAVVSDHDSGLRRISVSPPGRDGDTVVDDFIPGSTATVNVSHTTPCCVWEAEIIATDMADNQNKHNCLLYQACGRMRVFHSTATEVFVEWVIPCEFANVEMYEMIGTNMLTDPPEQANFNKVSCLDYRCSFNITEVPACVNYQVDLKAYEFENVANVKNYTSYLLTTNETEPSKPRFLKVENVSTTIISLSWHEPGLNKYCVAQYEVCYRSLHARELICNITIEKDIQLTNLDPCTNYHFTVSALTPKGLKSRPEVIDQRTAALIPGVPENVTVLNVDYDSISFGWIPPMNNPTCVNGYNHQCRPKEMFREDLPMSLSQNHLEHRENVTVDGLSSCVDYTCCVASVFYQQDENGNSQSEFKCFNETTHSRAPSEPTRVITMASLDHFDVFWEQPEIAPNCLKLYQISWFNVDVGNVHNATVDSLVLEYRIENLLPCSNYSITLTAIDEFNNAASTTTFKKTKDTAPGIATNLVIEEVTSSSFTACWDQPLENPQCVHDYDTDSKGCRPYHNDPFSEPKDGHHCSMENPLCCDSDYTFQLTLISSSGDRSPDAFISVTTKECTTGPTTTRAAPTTAKPTTAKPTTAKPTTAKPTTAKPTTAKPTTAKPTTAMPTTSKPTTATPSTSN